MRKRCIKIVFIKIIIVYFTPLMFQYAHRMKHHLSYQNHIIYYSSFITRGSVPASFSSSILLSTLEFTDGNVFDILGFILCCCK